MVDPGSGLARARAGSAVPRRGHPSGERWLVGEGVLGCLRALARGSGAGPDAWSRASQGGVARGVVAMRPDGPGGFAVDAGPCMTDATAVHNGGRRAGWPRYGLRRHGTPDGTWPAARTMVPAPCWRRRDPGDAALADLGKTVIRDGGRRWSSSVHLDVTMKKTIGATIEADGSVHLNESVRLCPCVPSSALTRKPSSPLQRGRGRASAAWGDDTPRG